MIVIVSSRPWHRELCDAVQRRTGMPVAFLGPGTELPCEKLDELGAQMVFFPHWSQRIAPAVFEKFECIIFHMTDVPYGRGGSPLQNLIVRGHDQTVISALRCSAEMDAGPVYMKKPLSLLGTADEILLRAARQIEDMIVEILEKKPSPVPQSGPVTVFRRRTPEQGNWANAQSLDEVFDFIRMLDGEGYPPAFVEVGECRLEFTRASRRVGAVTADVRITLREAALDEKQP